MSQPTCSVDECAKPSKTRKMCGMHAERARHHGDPLVRLVVRGDDSTRFWRRVEMADETSCWLWTGTTAGGGYGQFRVGERRLAAHRYAYELLLGPIPDGLDLDHVRELGCTHRNCVNPAHLEPVTPRVNTLRGDSPAAMNARKATCSRGHEFDRIITDANGGVRRKCSTCHRAASKASREQAKAMR